MVLDGDGVHAAEGLVEEDELGLGDQGPAISSLRLGPLGTGAGRAWPCG